MRGEVVGGLEKICNLEVMCVCLCVRNVEEVLGLLLSIRDTGGL